MSRKARFPNFTFFDAGANVFQDLGDTRTFDHSFPAFGGTVDLDLKIDPKNEVGFSEVSNSVTSLEQAWFVQRLKATSFTTALGPVVI